MGEGSLAGQAEETEATSMQASPAESSGGERLSRESRCCEILLQLEPNGALGHSPESRVPRQASQVSCGCW